MVKIYSLSLLIVFICVNLNLNNQATSSLETFQSLRLTEKKSSEIFETKENEIDNIKLKIEFFDLNTNEKLTDLNIDSSINSIGVKYELLVPSVISVQNYRFLSNFEFKDFKFKESPINRFKADVEKYKSEELRSVYIKEGVLYPKNKGTLNIEPVELELTIDMQTNKQDEYGGSVYKANTIKASSESTQVRWH